MMTADEYDGDNEAIISFDDDDDDMLELFSFGASSSPNAKSAQVDYSAAMASVMPLPKPVPEEDSSSESEDSLIELLEQNKEVSVSVVDAAALQSQNNKEQEKETADGGNEEDEGMDEGDMQEILDWLDQDDEQNLEEELLFVEPPKPPTLQESLLKSKEKQPTPTPPPPEFDTLEQAVKSSKSQISQIRHLLEKENFVVTSAVRPHLWCRVVCGKTLDETLQSSVADSFQQWEQHWQQDSPMKSKRQSSIRKKQLQWIQKESAPLAERIATVLKSDKELCQRALAAILINHYCTVHKNTMDEEDDDGSDDEQNDDNENSDHGQLMDTLLPPVACVLLSAGIPKVGASVMLSQIVPHFMPILALTTKERTHAASTLHQQFYLLACYHLPLLALHLDRYIPDWYKWPPTGFLPQSYLISHLAGECGKKAELNPRGLLCLWDLILTSSNNSLRFFLVMSILEQHSDQLLLLTNDALKEELRRVLTFQDYTTEDGFAIEEKTETTTKQAVRWVQDWTEKAQMLWENTPRSVVQMLKQLEDEAVKEALAKRQRDAEERLKLKLEAQARAHQEAAQAEQERKEEAARLRLTRARLVAFYRQYNPGKENNIDKIMKAYAGRYEVLDAKLKQKYGIGFNPAIKPKAPPKTSTQKLLPTGFGVRRGKPEASKQKQETEESKKPRDMAVQIQPEELVPSICWSKEANKANLLKLRKQSSRLAQPEEMKLPLRFYLIDCRPQDSILDQGRFPTSVGLSPETLLDMDQMKQMEKMLEGLRGTVHICIMGEGYSALPTLYGHKITRGLLEFIKEDEARVMNCALFFLKKGYPFVSVLDGGFAAAHAFLWREGPKVHLRAQNVLTDYNPDVSIFGQFERAHNASGREKAQRTLQGLFDSGMTALTKNTMRFESLSSEVGNSLEEDQPKAATNVVSRFWGSSDTAKKDDGAKIVPAKTESSATTSTGGFLNPFARKAQGQDEQPKVSAQASDDLEVESVDFDKISEETTETPGDNVSAEPDSSNQQLPQDTKSTEQPKPSPFSGLGAALNNSLKAGVAASPAPASTAAAARPRNPFARFGMGNQQVAKKAEVVGAGMASHFAGFNQLRKNTMARVRGGAGGANDTATNGAGGPVGEESVGLDQSSPATAPNRADETSGSEHDVPTEPIKTEPSEASNEQIATGTAASLTKGSSEPSAGAEEGTQQKAEITQV